MRLTQNEEANLLKAVLAKNGMSVSTGMALVRREEAGKATAAEVAVLDRLSRQVKESQRIASLQKRETRGDKSYRALSRSLSLNPRYELKAIAKSESAYQNVMIALGGRTKISRLEAVIVFTGTKESSEQPLSQFDIERLHVMTEAPDLVRLSVRRCKAMGFTVV